MSLQGHLHLPQLNNSNKLPLQATPQTPNNQGRLARVPLALAEGTAFQQASTAVPEARKEAESPLAQSTEQDAGSPRQPQTSKSNGGSGLHHVIRPQARAANGSRSEAVTALSLPADKLDAERLDVQDQASLRGKFDSINHI